MKKRRLIFPICIALVLLAAVLFAQFTSLGYRMTVPLRDFDEVLDNVYVDRSYTGDIGAVIETVEAASARHQAFWGDLQSTPSIIISDNDATIKKLGGDHDTTFFVLFGAHSYISVSAQYLTVDIMAHEMTHAELQKRLYAGKALSGQLVPTWFDEGVATQNDYRDAYSEESWAQQTNMGEITIPLHEMDTAAKFYVGTAEDRRFRYLLSRHEVNAWIAAHGMDALISLIDGVNQGADFHTLY